MFGGAGLYLDSQIFGLVIGGEIYLKCDDAIEPLFRAAGSHPFVYDSRGKTVTVGYWSLPSEALDDSDAMKLWAGRAFDAAFRSAKAKKPKTKRRKN
jgi:DNA transformation protein and related proteins